ncbi:clostripain-related cysteine peptidase [Olsenella porci]|nr:clostripain-related cysteine peptidase [Olsenella porci]
MTKSRVWGTRGMATLALACILSLSCLGLAGCADETPAGTPAGVSGTDLSTAGLRDYYVDVASAKSATVMVYMCGSDLESGYGAASADIEEMLEADLGDNVNVVLETGGASEWSFSPEADPSTRQRWVLEDGEASLVQDAGEGTMLDEDEVTDFCSWAAKEYPADRYILIFWDHGGGTIGGFGYDENYPDASALTLSQLRNAIKASGVAFDMVGFDACLMATVECAWAMEPVADYLVASEQTEPGDGWSWTGFLNQLGSDPSTATTDLGKTIIDDFSAHYAETGEEDTTLSLIDLREISRVYERLSSFLDEAADSIEADNALFTTMSGARSRAKSYAEDSVDQVDLVDMVDRSDFEGADDVSEAVASCVKYRSDTSSGSNGIAMYFPYSEVSQYSDVRQVLEDIGYTGPVAFYDYFLSVMGNSPTSSSHGIVSSYASTQVAQDSGTAASASSSSDSYANESLSSEGWFEDLSNEFSYQELPDELELASDGSNWVVEMDDSLWGDFADFQITVMQNYDDGYLMLGTDDAYQVTDDGNIAVDFDGEWLSIDGSFFSFYCDAPEETEDGEIRYSGTIPAILNGGERVDLVVTWPTASERGDGETIGYVQGYRMSGQDYVLGRGLGQLEAGDTLTPVFDYFDSEGNWVETLQGDAITVSDPSDVEVRYEDTGDASVLFWGTLTTVYGSQVDTEVLTTK